MSKLVRNRLFVLSFFFLFPLFSHAQVAKISFTTDSQTIQPNVLSGPITFQTQDVNGNSFPTPETIDLQFITTSPTGQFLGGTGNPVTKTMSTNSANRTFYYEDSTEGSYTLTVNATGRTSHNQWTVSQGIAVSSIPANSTSDSNSSSDNSASSTAVTPVTYNSGTATTVVSSISTHYSYLPLSDFQAQQNLSVSAGRDRLAAVGNPLQFQAEANISDDTVNYNWSFGDGTTQAGKMVRHSYEYPGTYVVVLNASLPDAKAVSRTTVTVVDPQLNVTEANNRYINIKNDANKEINLYGWEIISEGKHFVFPLDTIIQAGQSVCFPADVTGLSPIGATDVQILPVSEAPLTMSASPQQTSSSSDIALQQKRAAIYQELLTLKQEANTLAANTVSEPIAKISTEASSTNDAEVAAPIESETSNSWVTTLKHFFFGTQ